MSLGLSGGGINGRPGRVREGEASLSILLLHRQRPGRFKWTDLSAGGVQHFLGLIFRVGLWNCFGKTDRMLCQP